MILYKNEFFERARLIKQRETERAEFDEEPQDPGQALVLYEMLLAQLKQTLARG